MAHNNGNKATLTSNLDKCENQNESGREDEESEFQTTPLHNIYIYIVFFKKKGVVPIVGDLFLLHFGFK